MHENELKNIAAASGACDCGFADISDCVPCDVLPSLTNAVSFAYRLSGAVLSTITDRPSIMYFQHYRAVNARLDQIALDICAYIERCGYIALPVAASQSRPSEKYAGVFSHKTAAYRAGLGFIGRNNLLISPVYGGGLRFATVLTNMPLEHGVPIADMCTGCGKCVAVCPAGALNGRSFDPAHPEIRLIDPVKCSAHMKTYSDIGRGAVCGLCMRACPFTFAG